MNLMATWWSYENLPACENRKFRAANGDVCLAGLQTDVERGVHVAEQLPLVERRSLEEQTLQRGLVRALPADLLTVLARLGLENP